MSRDSFWSRLARKLEVPVRPEVDARILSQVEKELQTNNYKLSLSWTWIFKRVLVLATPLLLVLWFEYRPLLDRSPRVGEDTTVAVDLDVELLESLDWLETLQDDEIQILAELSEEEFRQLIDN